MVYIVLLANCIPAARHFDEIAGTPFAIAFQFSEETDVVIILSPSISTLANGHCTYWRRGRNASAAVT
jgi:hypothetical protein